MCPSGGSCSIFILFLASCRLWDLGLLHRARAEGMVGGMVGSQSFLIIQHWTLLQVLLCRPQLNISLPYLSLYPRLCWRWRVNLLTVLPSLSMSRVSLLSTFVHLLRFIELDSSCLWWAHTERETTVHVQWLWLPAFVYVAIVSKGDHGDPCWFYCFRFIHNWNLQRCYKASSFF